MLLLRDELGGVGLEGEGRRGKRMNVGLGECPERKFFLPVINTNHAAGSHAARKKHYRPTGSQLAQDFKLATSNKYE